MSGGWFDADAIASERFDADMGMAEFERDGASRSRRYRKMKALRAAGRLDEAAAVCPHGGGYPLDLLAASNANDPRAGQTGVRCDSCGSALTCFPWDGTPEVIAPCEYVKGGVK